jgi:hypothetical protein
MSANNLYDMLHRRPFVPFCIFTSDGTVYEVRHPDLLMIGLSSVIIGYPSEQAPYAYSRWDVVSMGHIVRLEPREETASAPGAN